MKNDSIYPICPECKKPTVVLFSPPKEPVNFALLGKQEYVDWYRAHLYCCNAESNCKFSPLLTDLTTPLKQPKYCCDDHPGMSCAEAHKYHVEGLVERDFRIDSDRELIGKLVEALENLTGEVSIADNAHAYDNLVPALEVLKLAKERLGK